MAEETTQQTNGDARVFRKRLPLRVRLAEILRALGKTDGLSCLDVGLDSGVMSHHLRKRGGEWYTVVSMESLVEPVKSVVGENVFAMEGKNLPFRKKVFDAVVVSDIQGRFEPEEDFIEECHRILKPDGRLVMTVANRKTFSLMPAIRQLLGSRGEGESAAAPGHTESELFGFLKHGFDVANMRTFSRFFVELTDAWTRYMVTRRQARVPFDERAVARLYTVAGIFYALAAQLDMLLFFTRGHYLVASAKRRAWRPRKTPVLTDGRTITEAVLTRAPR